MSSMRNAMNRPKVHTRMHLLPGFTLLISCNEITISGQNEEVTEELILVETFIQSPQPKVDILWVVDNSQSMEREHAALQPALEPFVDELTDSEVAWQMGVIRADLEDEDLGLLTGDPWIMSPSLEAPLEALQQAIQVGTEGGGPSGGLAAASLALSEPLRSEGNRGFRRNDAALHIIIFSDSDDDSSSILGDDPEGNFLDFISEEVTITGQQAQVSAIVGDPSTGCLGAGGAALPGDSYIRLAQATGGTTGSICETDLTDLLSLLGAASIPWSDRFELQAIPVEESLRVSIDGERLDSGWWLESDPASILFVDPPAPGAEIEIRYEVAE